TQFAEGWDGERPRLFVVRDESSAWGFGARSKVVAAIHPWSEIVAMPEEPAGLYELSWGPRNEARALDIVWYEGPFVDCGTPAGYLNANLAASGGTSVVGSSAVVAGTVDRSVVWSGAFVSPG